MQRILALLILWTVIGSTGCLTRAGGALQPLDLEPATDPPAIEYTVGDFDFTLEGGKMITSNQAGKIISNEIFKRWKKHGYISEFKHVKDGKFTGDAHYQLTLSGTQYGESNVALSFISGLTLLLIPSTVDTKFDLQYTLENPATGAKLSASAVDSYHTTTELFLLFALPWSARGSGQTFSALGDHLYKALSDQGAFGGTTTPAAP